jgi:hypothetical protein
MKKEYTKPQLVKHGKLEEQTQAGAELGNDGLAGLTS